MSKTNAILEPSPFFDPSIFADAVADFRRDVTRARRIGFLVYPDIEIIDLCGPLDVFSYADWWARERKRGDELGCDVRVIAPKPGPVRTQCGVDIVATHGLEDVTEGLDTLIVAGGIGVAQACAEPALVEWIKMMAPGVRRLASVCTGAFLLAAAGLLTNRRVTTHWGVLRAACGCVSVASRRSQSHLCP